MDAIRILPTVCVASLQFVPQTSQACQPGVDGVRFATARYDISIRPADRAYTATGVRTHRGHGFVHFQQLGDQIRQIDAAVDERSDVRIQILVSPDILTERLSDLDLCAARKLL